MKEVYGSARCTTGLNVKIYGEQCHSVLNTNLEAKQL